MKLVLSILLFLKVILAFSQSNGSTFLKSYTPKLRYQNVNKFDIKQLYLPSTIILSGVALNGSQDESFKNEIVEERNEHFSGFRTHIDDYLQFAPIAIAYGFDAFGLSSKTDFKNKTAILLKGEFFMMTITTTLKRITKIQRPDFSNYHSFPSGHTAQAFAAATFLSEEYKYKFKWMPYVSYGIAASVGMSRMANNKHYISDVLVGAGIGYLSMKIAYWTHQYKWNKKIRNNGI
ncbi:MAG TPA: phosphatase PAP2 family protein [Saprospiraceae bacterium]|nr:phosphatase PAP2 family protein [Saprospiraceae bacterium]MCB9327951.1 phosphatase PAP2 family protein [Lewinellaceae bacterium]HPK09145.1 phosphatase PAP2 family protein [Saprospiraceae bacterium]HRX28559.1 phosphatase PAP2 family protein [Saprospiraceae bacterium]